MLPGEYCWNLHTTFILLNCFPSIIMAGVQSTFTSNIMLVGWAYLLVPLATSFIVPKSPASVDRNAFSKKNNLSWKHRSIKTLQHENANSGSMLGNFSDRTLQKNAAKAAASSAAPQQQQQKLRDSICTYHQITIPAPMEGPPSQKIHVQDITSIIQSLLNQSEMCQGVVNIISRHTTTAITINEYESRLIKDMEEFFLRLAPPDDRSDNNSQHSDGFGKGYKNSNNINGIRYYHNDIDQRPDTNNEAQLCRDNGWDIDTQQGLQAWRNQEPINAHSHLLSMILGNSESIPVVNNSMVIGQWQSVMLVDLDGPRQRSVGIQFLGYKEAARASEEI